jgi:2-polyprenyl-3-methyl-5-hydroxy-6-metoxy-1,4-benzoquinol methylase
MENMADTPSAFDQLKQGMRATWMAGDFGQLARVSARHGEEFVAGLGIRPGIKALDVACGTGNLAIPAARAGAKVTGLDIAPNLLEQARQRAAEERLDVTFDEGDAEQLPYADGAFDMVMSMFGAMFAPRPDRVAAELIRVCRPGGTIAMANWPPTGFAAKLFGAGMRFVQPPEGIPSPLAWGDAAIVKQRLAHGTSEVRTTMRPFQMKFPQGPRGVVDFFRKYFGPVHTTFARLDPQQQAEYAATLESLWAEHNQATDGSTLVQGEYLEVIATRR